MAYDSFHRTLYVAEQGADQAPGFLALVTGTCTLVGTVILGNSSNNGAATALAFDPANDWIYATGASDGLFVVNGSRLLGTVDVPGASALCYDPAIRGMAILANNNVTFVVGTQTVRRVAATTFALASVAYAPVENYLVVTQGTTFQTGFELNATEFNASTGALVRTIPVGQAAEAAAYDPADGRMYVTIPKLGNEVPGGNSVAAIDLVAGRVTKRIAVGQQPLELTYDPADRAMWVVNWYGGTVSVLEYLRVIATYRLPALDGLSKVAFDPASGYVYASEATGVLAVFGSPPIPSPVLATLTGYSVWALLYDPVNAQMYGAPEGASPGSVSAFNGTSYAFLTSIPAGKEALPYVSAPLGLDPTLDRLFVQEGARSGTGELGAIAGSSDTDVSAHKYLDGCGVGSPTYDPLDGLLYVTCGGIGPNGTLELGVVNPLSLALERLIPYSFPPYPGESGSGLAVDLRTGNLYVPHGHYSGGTLSVVDPTTGRVVRNIGLARFPGAAIYDPVNDLIDVEFPGSAGSIVVVDPATESVVRTISVPNLVSMIVIPEKNELAVLGGPLGTNALSFWNASTGAVLGIEFVPGFPAALAYDSATHTIWTADPYERVIGVLRVIT